MAQPQTPNAAESMLNNECMQASASHAALPTNEAAQNSGSEVRPNGNQDSPNQEQIDQCDHSGTDSDSSSSYKSAFDTFEPTPCPIVVVDVNSDSDASCETEEEYIWDDCNPLDCPLHLINVPISEHVSVEEEMLELDPAELLYEASSRQITEDGVFESVHYNTPIDVLELDSPDLVSESFFGQSSADRVDPSVRHYTPIPFDMQEDEDDSDEDEHPYMYAIRSLPLPLCEESLCSITEEQESD